MHKFCHGKQEKLDKLASENVPSTWPSTFNLEPKQIACFYGLEWNVSDMNHSTGSTLYLGMDPLNPFEAKP